MTRFRKIKEKIEQKNPPKDILFDEIRVYLEHYGFKLTNTNGSHHKFKDKEDNFIIIPVHSNKVKFCYIKEAKNLINKESKQWKKD